VVEIRRQRGTHWQRGPDQTSPSAS
jgi:hypothetical protein